MRILQVNKFLYRKAGAEAYVLDLVEMLKAHGHEVMMWGTGERLQEVTRGYKRLQEVTRGYKRLQEVTAFEDLLVEPLNFDRREGLLVDLKKFGHMIWSLEAARKFERVVREFKPDVVHVHNIYHHISPSILRVAKKYGVPVVMTVHDYHLINPNYTLYDHGAICERQGFSAMAHRCIKNSFVASAADAIEWQVHRWLGIYKHTISRYLAPTEFVKGKLIGGGVDGGKILVVPLPVILNEPQRSEESRSDKHGIPSTGSGQALRAAQDDKFGDYILFAGRLTEEKGIYLVLELAKRLPEINFKIAGTGPEESGVRGQVSGVRGQGSGVRNVEVLGFVEKEKLKQLIAGARLVLVPSLWYDPLPLAVLEAMAAGKVVVGSRIGGIPELVQDGKTGILVGANYESIANLRISNSQIRKFDNYSQFAPQWIDAIKKIYYDEKLLARVGKAAQEYIRRVHNPEKHYARLMKIYEETINKTYRTN